MPVIPSPEPASEGGEDPAAALHGALRLLMLLRGLQGITTSLHQPPQPSHLAAGSHPTLSPSPLHVLRFKDSPSPLFSFLPSFSSPPTLLSVHIPQTAG